MAQAATQFIAELVKNELIIELEKLCIRETKWVWVLHIDLICLNLDGGLLDTCVIALVAALKDCESPLDILELVHMNFTITIMY